MEKIGKTLMQTLVRASNYTWRAVASRCDSPLARNVSYMAYTHSCFGFLPYMQRNIEKRKNFSKNY